MRASSRSSRSASLRIKGRPAEDFESGRPSGGLGSPTAMVAGVFPVGYLPLPGKGKEKISEIRYSCGSEYLRVAVRYTDVVGPNRVEPLFAKTSLPVMDLLSLCKTQEIPISRKRVKS